MKRLNIFSHPSGLSHDTGPGHPETAARLDILRKMMVEPEFENFKVIEPEKASFEQIIRAHSKSHLQDLEDADPDRGLIAIDAGDTILSPSSLEAIYHAAGAPCQAVDAIHADDIDRAFCMNRPPGHHAEKDRAMGFCFLNNVFIGAMHARATYGYERIAIVDFDVHHGNATDNMAREHEGFFYVSTHEWPLFPGTGNPDNNIDERILNVTLPHGGGSKGFRERYNNIILPALKSYNPDFLFISAGFDAHKKDHISGVNLEDSDFEWITKKLVEIADESCEGKIVSVLEGGYNLEALKNGVALHIKALAETD